MRFLADESCDFAVVRVLRNQGFDVLAVSETCPGAEDQQVIELARKEGRVGVPRIGVILLRFPARARHDLRF